MSCYYALVKYTNLDWVTPCKEITDEFSEADPLLSAMSVIKQNALAVDDIKIGEYWGIPCDLSGFLQVKGGDKKVKPMPPDISQGLGRSQSKRDIVQLEKYLVDSARFIVYDGVLCAYQEPCWKKLKNEDAEVMIRKVLEEAGLGDCLIYQDFCKLRKNLRINPRIQVTQELSSPENKVNFLDGTYDLVSRHFLPHNPDDCFFHAIKCTGEAMQNCPGDVFEAFVGQLSDGDLAIRQQLLELTAFTILGKQVKHFYVLLGESNTGKTQFGRFLEELVGRENVESTRGVHDFADRWTVGNLKGKLLATCLDIPDAPLLKEAVGIIKQFVGDDPVKGEQKNKDPFTFYRKPMLLFAGNHPLRIPNMAQEQALLNRMVVIPFCNPVPEGRMEQALYKKLLNEAPYIVRQALNAYEDLMLKNFEVTRSEIPPQYAPQEGRQEAKQAIEFLESYCCKELGAETATTDVYDQYCQVVGGRNLLNFVDFSRVLSKYVQNWEMVSPIKRVNGRERRGYRGFRLLEC